MISPWVTIIVHIVSSVRDILFLAGTVSTILTFIGAIISVGLPRCLKKPKKPCFLRVAPSIRIMLIKARAIVTLRSLVGGFMPNIPMIFAVPIYISTVPR